MEPVGLGWSPWASAPACQAPPASVLREPCGSLPSGYAAASCWSPWAGRGGRVGGRPGQPWEVPGRGLRGLPQEPTAPSSPGGRGAGPASHRGAARRWRWVGAAGFRSTHRGACRVLCPQVRRRRLFCPRRRSGGCDVSGGCTVSPPRGPRRERRLRSESAPRPPAAAAVRPLCDPYDQCFGFCPSLALLKGTIRSSSPFSQPVSEALCGVCGGDSKHWAPLLIRSKLVHSAWSFLLLESILATHIFP